MEQKYKVGDRVRVLKNGFNYGCEGLKEGCVTKVCSVENGDIFVDGKYEDGTVSALFMKDEWLEPAEDAVANLNLNIDITPETTAMNEFADACERAVAALEKLNTLLNK